jgi:hypothetical protein
MIQSLHIENFRCFEKVDLQDLRLINVIVGSNSGGKTSLLESVFLSGGTPELVFRFDTWRGLNFPINVQTKAEFESCWKDIFYKFDQSKQIKVSAEGHPECHRNLKIYYNYTEQIPLFPEGKPSGSMETDSTALIPLVFESADSKGKPYYQQPVIGPTGGIVLRGLGAPIAPMAFYSSAHIPPAPEAAQRYSQLRQRNDKAGERVNDTLSRIFPSISNLSIEVDSGGLPAVYCDALGMDKKIPVGLVSSGIHKTLAILLGIASYPNGAILIDEIENGIHYKSLPKVWEALIAFCEEYKTQLFVSTHSKECLEQLIPHLNKNPDNFRLLRAETTQDGDHVVKNFSGDEFQAALETGVDPR